MKENVSAVRENTCDLLRVIASFSAVWMNVSIQWHYAANGQPIIVYGKVIEIVHLFVVTVINEVTRFGLSCL